MSMRVIKGNGNGIELPNDDVVIQLQVTRSGKIILNAPMVHPREVSKLLFSVIVDILYGSFQMQEQSPILTPVKQDMTQ